MKYFVKLWNGDISDYVDYTSFDTYEEAKKEVEELKKNGEGAIIESFAECQRDYELSEEVDWYNDHYND